MPGPWSWVLSADKDKMMMCTCSREQLNLGEMPQSPDSLATREFSASGFSSRTGEADCRPDHGNIEEAESSLREGLSLNYEVGLSTWHLIDSI